MPQLSVPLQLLIVVVLFIVVANVGDFLNRVLPQTLHIVPRPYNYALIVILQLITGLLLVRRHMRTQELPATDSPRPISLIEPQLVVIIPLGLANLLSELSAASVVGVVIFSLFFVGIAGNVGRFPGKPRENNKFLAVSVGILLFYTFTNLMAVLRL